jgi:hypothetical protein
MNERGNVDPWEGTKMNDTSSRSHCVTVFTLSTVDNEGLLRQSRLQCFDLMGSERFKGRLGEWRLRVRVASMLRKGQYVGWASP